MQPTSRICRTAKALYFLSTVLLIGLPLGLMLALFSGTLGVHSIREAFDSVTLPEVLSLPVLLIVYATGAVQVGLVMVVLWQMRCLFDLYARAQMLTEIAALRIRRVAQGLLWLSAAGIVTWPINVVALTWGNPPGQRVLSVGIQQSDIGFFLAGALLLLIGWVMGHAVAVARENEGFV